MINYPNGIRRQRILENKKPAEKKVNFANRGMNFETEINASNDYYLSRKIAVVHKRPTPIQIVKVDYPKRSKAKITEAYFRQASTTDYSGVYQGKYLDFEAKESKQKTMFPMKNFHDHQLEHMDQVLRQGGISFVLLHFSALYETYFLDSKFLIDYYKEHGTNKSLPIKYIKRHGHQIEMSGIPRVPYLEVINKYYLGEK
ncbi:Holliday junction resolvase RecU [Streptococcaceae bacterium ESL0729]|nr:Holliday junction resolvase RecU [Streptococcaceae bacterium ESL0729]